MRRAIAIAGTGAVILGAFGGGVVTAIARNWGDNAVAVTIVNASSAPIAELVILHESCRGIGTLSIGTIEPGASRTTKISMCGTGAFSVQAKLGTGETIKGREEYAQTSRRYVQVVTRAGIEAKNEYAL